MSETARLAGFFAAHGIWSVSDGETLIPLRAYEYDDGQRGFERILADDLKDAVADGRAALETNEEGAVRAVLVADTYLHTDEGPVDALMVEAVEYGGLHGLGWSVTFAVPYRAQPSPGGFAVYRPKFWDLDGVDEADQPKLAEAFFDGVDSHEDAAPVWNAHYDDVSV